MSVTYRPARREGTSTLTAFAGPSGGGKTYTALRYARGLVGPNGKIAFLDTEAGRGLHYADQFDFDHAELHPPFRPASYKEAIATAEQAKYQAIVIDSASHEWEGDGGLLEWADEIGGPGKWKDPKREHKKMMSRLLQCRIHLVFCLRAEEKVKMVKDPKTGKIDVIPIGWQPICEKRFMYEMTASFLLLDDNPGVPQPIKLQDQHRHCFPAGEKISEESGRLMAEWASGGAAPEPETSASETQAKLFLTSLQSAPDLKSLAAVWKQVTPHLAAFEDGVKHQLTTVKDLRKRELS